MEIKDYLLEGPNVKFKKTPNHSGEFKAGDLDTIIIHYTAGPENVAINTLTNPRVKASAHLVVGRQGNVTQLAPFNIMTWHAGSSSYKGRTGFNKYSIGIEIANDGWLTKSGNVYRAWYGGVHEANEVIEAVHRNQSTPKYWHTYTEEQIAVVTEICQLLVESYNIRHILGHEEIAPTRKQDPGPAFPLDRLRDRLLKSRRDEDEADEIQADMIVRANKLNIRSKPVTGDTVALPLTNGKKVRVLEEKDGWYRVKTEIEGWVLGKFLEPEA